MIKTAIFGGTFNPPHNGHVAMLQRLAKNTEIQKILILPSKTPPHKSEDIVSAEHRVNMCRLAFSNTEKAELCLCEFDLPGKSYTSNTLEFLKEKGIDHPIFVIGADSLVDFSKWYKYQEILKKCSLLVYKRYNIEEDAMLSAKLALEKLGGKIKILDFCPPNISSTKIRELLKKGHSVEDLLPNSVTDYIKERGLYNGTHFSK